MEKQRKIVIAMDSFKGCFTSIEAGEIVAEGILRKYPLSQVEVCPMADGGEGTADVLVKAMGGTTHSVQVMGPLGQPVTATYGILEKTRTGVMEMAQAAGLTLVSPEQRNPMKTTTYGVGQLILQAVHQGCSRVILGIGGSGTNDGGAGMLQALGFDLLNTQLNPISWGAEGLEELESISSEFVENDIRRCCFQVACDVTNPLWGPEGASFVFGPQKGGNKKTCARMDQLLRHFGEVARKFDKEADVNAPGAGAAGGMGFACQTFLGAQLESGFQLVSRETGLEDKIKGADLVITGEGCLDGQTGKGKVPYGVAGMAHKYGKPVYGFAGIVTPEAVECRKWGMIETIQIKQKGQSLEESMKPEMARQNLLSAVEGLELG